MCKYPALPLFTDAWVADTCHLTRLERGTYADLLVLMWRTPGCRVPNDDKWLARHMRMTPAEVETELRPLIEEFCQNTGNWIMQKRLRKEFAYVQERRPKQRELINRRWQNPDDDLSERNSVPVNTLKYNKTLDTTLPHPTYKKDARARAKDLNFGLEGKKGRPEPAVELSEDALAAIAAHQARERELAERERNPIKTARGMELTKAWLERKGLPPTMEPLRKAGDGAINGYASLYPHLGAEIGNGRDPSVAGCP